MVCNNSPLSDQLSRSSASISTWDGFITVMINMRISCAARFDIRYGIGIELNEQSPHITEDES